MKGTISIIIPIYNAEAYLKKCVDSVIGQSMSDIRVFLIDDGSTDNSLRLCNDYAKSDDRVTVIHKDNGGPSSARNMGIKASDGEYLLFVDADDYVTHDCCAALMSERNKSGAEWIIGRRLIDDVRAVRKSEQTSFECDEWRSLGEEMCDLYLNGELNFVTGRLYLRSKITNEFDEGLSLGEDLIFNLAYLREIVRVSVVEEYCYCYVVREASLSRVFRENYMNVCKRLHFEACGCFSELTAGYNMNRVSYIFLVDFRRGISMLTNTRDIVYREKHRILAGWLSDGEAINILRKAETTEFSDRIFVFLIRLKCRALVYGSMKLFRCLFRK